MNQKVPINSVLNIIINTNSKNFTVKDNGELVVFNQLEKDNYQTSILLERKKNISIEKPDGSFFDIGFNLIKDNSPNLKFLA